jgi:hypothetical protein
MATVAQAFPSLQTSAAADSAAAGSPAADAARVHARDDDGDAVTQ